MRPETREAPAVTARSEDAPAPVPGRGDRRIRFGIAFRLLGALLAITGFALAAIAVALYAFSQYRQGFDRIASSSLPILIAASEIAAQSQALAANVRNLAVAENHFERQAVTQALRDQLKTLEGADEHLKSLAPETKGLDRLFRSQQKLQANLDRLDALVAARIEADHSAANLMLRVVGLAGRIDSAARDRRPLVVEEGSRERVEAFLAWTAATDEAMAVMLATSTADSSVRLRRLHSDFGALRGLARAALSRLPEPAPELAPFEIAIDQYGSGTPNVFDARAAQLSSFSAVSGAVLETQDVSAEFVASAQSLFQEIERDTYAQSDYFAGLISAYSRIFTIISALCLVGSAAVYFYLVNSVILRIRRLSDSMRARIDGRDVPIPASGNDEIGEMAGATQFFISSIEQRERTVRARTAELAQSVEELQALGDVSQAVNSTIDLKTVLSTIVAKAVQLSGADAGTIWVYDEAKREFRLSASYGMDDALVAGVEHRPIRMDEMTVVNRAVLQRAPNQIADLQQVDASSLVLDIILRAGFRALLTVPLLGADRIVGALVVRRREPGEFPKNTVELLQTFAAQSVVAIENARLFHEIEEKGRQLEIASRHKSQFVANMSHELRTPLAAILGYAELLKEGIYGALPEKSTPIVGRIQSNGTHLLGLINNVLDLSKIEAGQFSLHPAEYALSAMVENVRVATESLAAAKKIALKTEVARDLPHGLGDEQRLTQVLLNLVGNAIKFTDTGEVRISAGVKGGRFTLAVSDTGPGIPAEERHKIFEEFHQVDSSDTRRKGGTGLGLAIAKQIVEMHGGHIWVESTLGKGSTFFVELPVRIAAEGAT